MRSFRMFQTTRKFPHPRPQQNINDSNCSVALLLLLLFVNPTTTTTILSRNKKTSKKDKASVVTDILEALPAETPQVETALVQAATIAATTDPNVIPQSSSTKQTLQMTCAKSHTCIELNYRQQPCSDITRAIHRQQLSLYQTKAINRQRHVQTKQ